MLAAASYFWSDALNAFMFGDGPIAPSLLDVYMLTGLDITSSTCPFLLKAVNKHILDTRSMMNWSRYITTFSKTSETVSDKEHAAFLNMWLENFIFCGSTSIPSLDSQCFAKKLPVSGEIPLEQYLLGTVFFYASSVNKTESGFTDQPKNRCQ